MILTYIRPNGTLPVHEEAELAGFVPGAAVDLVVLSSGSLLVRLHEEPPLDVPYVRGLRARKLAILSQGGGSS